MAYSVTTISVQGCCNSKGWIHLLIACIISQFYKLMFPIQNCPMTNNGHKEITFMKLNYLN